jgi:hypothetical protein
VAHGLTSGIRFQAYNTVPNSAIGRPGKFEEDVKVVLETNHVVVVSWYAFMPCFVGAVDKDLQKERADDNKEEVTQQKMPD